MDLLNITFNSTDFKIYNDLSNQEDQIFYIINTYCSQWASLNMESHIFYVYIIIFRLILRFLGFICSKLKIQLEYELNLGKYFYFKYHLTKDTRQILLAAMIYRILSVYIISKNIINF